LQAVYVKARDSLLASPGEEITLGMVAELLSSDLELERELRGRPLLPGLDPGHGAVILSSLDLVRAVKGQNPDLDVRMLGADHTVIRPRLRPRPWLTAFWTVGVALVLFFGAFMAIMSFHADVDMGLMHRGLYQLVTGRLVERPLIIQVPYSFGVGLGVLLFFNSLSRRRPSSDPSPLDVEMHSYDQEADQYLVTQGTPASGPRGKQK
jgi:stage V sporulation protein AA